MKGQIQLNQQLGIHCAHLASHFWPPPRSSLIQLSGGAFSFSTSLSFSPSSSFSLPIFFPPFLSSRNSSPLLSPPLSSSPLLPSHSTSCTPDVSGSPVCYCRPGHEGSLCDSCSPGFFGQPPNFRCTQCDCNGNIDPSVPGSCDMSTGVCLLCINNTIGDECERCAPGFFGDATTQNCTREIIHSNI